MMSGGWESRGRVMDQYALRPDELEKDIFGQYIGCYIHWDGDDVFILDGHFSLEQLRKMIDYAQAHRK